MHSLRIDQRFLEKRVYMFDKPTDFETLGLMQKVGGVYLESEKEFCSDKESYCFLHLTLQEYLAAYYCSLQEKPTETLQTLLTLDRSQQGYPPLHSILSYYRIDSITLEESKNNHCTVVLFAVGISESKMFQDLSDVIETYDGTQVFSSLHLLYETQSSDLICRIFSTLKTPASDSDQFDLLKVPYHSDSLHSFVTGYCIAHSSRLWLLDNGLSNGNFTQQQYEALSKGLNMSSDYSNGHIMVMNLHAHHIERLQSFFPHCKGRA